MVSFRVKVWVTYIVFLSNGSFVLRVEGDSLQMVSFRVKVWVTYIVFLSNGIFRSQSKRATLYRWSVLGLRFGLLILSFSPMDLSFSE